MLDVTNFFEIPFRSYFSNVQVGRNPYVLVGMPLVISIVLLIQSLKGLGSWKWFLVSWFGWIFLPLQPSCFASPNAKWCFTIFCLFLFQTQKMVLTLWSLMSIILKAQALHLPCIMLMRLVICLSFSSGSAP